MTLFSTDHIEKGSFKDLIIHFVPAIFVISLFELVAIEVYLHTPIHESQIKFFVWRTAQAVGGFALGYLSDKYCKKKVLIITQVSAVLILPLLWQDFALFPVFLIGLFFNPSPVARAALVDNFPNESKVKVIAITYIAQFIPWCFFLIIKGFNPPVFLLTALISLVVNSIICFLFFEDRKDKKHDVQNEITREYLHKKSSKGAFYTLAALLPAQLVFFISDTFFESLTSNGIYSVLGIGSLIGVIIAIFYRKIPHLSLLTLSYGIGILLSFVPLISNYLIPEVNINLTYQLVIFSNLGGFYLPFVFDVVLSATSAKYRGTACGVIDLILSLASIIGVAAIVFFHPNEQAILVITTTLFLIATIIQKKGEKHA